MSHIILETFYFVEQIGTQLCVRIILIEFGPTAAINL